MLSIQAIQGKIPQIDEHDTSSTSLCCCSTISVSMSPLQHLLFLLDQASNGFSMTIIISSSLASAGAMKAPPISTSICRGMNSARAKSNIKSTIDSDDEGFTIPIAILTTELASVAELVLVSSILRASIITISISISISIFSNLSSFLKHENPTSTSHASRKL
eukprot:c39857_g1_i1 orf=578-1066(+)